jgi:hypothetical protein
MLYNFHIRIYRGLLVPNLESISFDIPIFTNQTSSIPIQASAQPTSTTFKYHHPNKQPINPINMSSMTGQDSHNGPRGNAGKASSVQTPANAHLGQDKPGVFDEQGAIGKQFTRKLLLLSFLSKSMI